MKQLILYIAVVLGSLNAFSKTPNVSKPLVHLYKTSVSDEIINIDGQYYRIYDDIIEPVDNASNKFAQSPQKWTDGKVFYEFAEDVTAQNRTRFLEAAQEWSKVAQLNFIERNDEPNYIHVQNGNRNYAIVGMTGNKQVLSIVSWGSKFVIVHEIGHALGMWHEHQRSDRDDYVTINFDNIQSDQTYNFSSRATDNLAEYDFLSIMHYPLNAYTSNGKRTIEPKPQYQSIAMYAGQRNFISAGDQLGVAKQYGAKPISIPDANFRNFLLEQFDSNGDQQLDSIEALQIHHLQTPGNGQIQSLEGIEHFRQLKSLVAANENLTELPKLPPLLETLDLSNNLLDALSDEIMVGLFVKRVSAQGNLFDVYDCEKIKLIENKLGANNIIVNPLNDGSSLVCDEESDKILINAKPRVDLRSKGSRYFYIDVPAGQSVLTFTTSLTNDETGGLMDMYVAYDRIPTPTDYDEVSNNEGNVESISITQPEAGRWFVNLIPNDRSFENIDLLAQYESTQIQQRALILNTPVEQLQAKKGQSLEFYLDVSENLTHLDFSISGGTGDADLYVRYQGAPSLTEYDCRPYKIGNAETCRVF